MQKLIKYTINIFSAFMLFVTHAQTPCEFGLSANFPCNNFEFLGQIDLNELGADVFGNDCWGWTDPQTGKEWAIMGVDNGTGFIDISDPVNPILKLILLNGGNYAEIHRDIKVYNNFAFIVAEIDNHGMQIFDLTHLREANPIPIEDANFSGFSRAHNLVMNEDSGYIYAVGADTYSGGPHFINVQNPLNPIDVGGFDGEGYSHDAQVITYNGPDPDYIGKEIYFGANETSVVIVDITDKTNPTTIAEFVYSSAAYTHQLWLDEARKYIYIGDEQDELNTGIHSRTIIFDVSNLDNPTFHTEYFGPTTSIDHNVYTHNNKLYIANYTAGMRVIDISDAENNNFNEIGFFDTHPSNNDVTYDGAWSVYPYFTSGNIIISDINEGLIIVRENITNVPPPTIGLPNDCVNSIIICGNSDISLDVDGPGNEIEIGTNACSGGETNSVWFQFTPETAGTLGFTLTPESTDIGEDYDFWVFGPNVTCDNLGTAIRCSTTNPDDANQGNNLTGLSATAGDFSEGPGTDGDSFVQWLDVQAGDTYYLIINRAEGQSAFNLQWTGTATFPTSPVNNLSPSFTLDQQVCDVDGDGLERINLTILEGAVVSTQDVTVNYFESLFLAQINQNAIITPASYNAPLGASIVYMRLTDNISGCFSVFEMNLEVLQLPINQPQDLNACDTDNDGYAVFDLTVLDQQISGIANNPLLTYSYTSGGGATIISDPTNFTNTRVNQQQIIATLSDPAFNGCTAQVSFYVHVNQTPTANPVNNWFVCDDDDQNIGFYNFDFSTLENEVLLTQDTLQFLITYYHSQQDAVDGVNALPTIYTNQNALTQETIYIRIENIDNAACYDITQFDINVYEAPNITANLTEYFCINIEDYELELIVNAAGNYDYEWRSPTNQLLATTQNYNVTQPGTYILTATTTDGNNCTTEKIINVLPAEPATINNVIINDFENNNLFYVEVEVTGAGIYQYAIDDENGTYQDSPIFLNVPQGLHTIYVKEIHGCGNTSISIAVFGFPPFFTPNGDGYHEFWQTGLTFQPEAKITIFDRYGKIMTVFYPGLNQHWDGLYQNKPALETDYWFMAELIDNNGLPVIRKGHFSLVRTLN